MTIKEEIAQIERQTTQISQVYGAIADNCVTDLVQEQLYELLELCIKSIKSRFLPCSPEHQVILDKYDKFMEEKNAVS